MPGPDTKVRHAKVKRLPDTSQSPLAFQVAPSPRPSGATVDRYHFPRDPIFIGSERLEDYLRSRELGWIIDLRDLLLAEVDFKPLMTHTATKGRRPYHPAVYYGLVVYGVLQGKSSLRELETLARLDAGAWLFCGSAQPDHSSIGYFLNDHSEQLSKETFLSLTKRLIVKLELNNGFTAIDGTTIEAAASRYALVRGEALREHAQALRTKADAEANARAEAAAKVAEQAVVTYEERVEKRAEQSRQSTTVAIVPHEPEAVVQPTKSGAFRPAYKASLIAHESGMIVGQEVHSSSEQAAVPGLLQQHEQLFGASPERCALDGNYCDISTLSHFTDRDTDVLCPESAKKLELKDTTPSLPSAASKFRKVKLPLFEKNQFTFVESADEYRCPADQVLVRRQVANTGLRPHVRYQGTACGNCPLRPRCVKGKGARTLRRYRGEELVEQMREIMKHPLARERFTRRKVTVEPRFATIKGPQRLTRFARRGLRGSRLEWSLHCQAHNLRKALSLLRRSRAPCRRWHRHSGARLAQWGRPHRHHGALTPRALSQRNVVPSGSWQIPAISRQPLTNRARTQKVAAALMFGTP